MYMTSDFMGFSAPMVPVEPFEEQLLLDALVAGDRDAREQLLERKLPLVLDIVRKLGPSDMAEEDLVQLGSIGLMKALDRYSPELRESIDGLIVTEIRKEICRYQGDSRPSEPEKADLCAAMEHLSDMERAVLTLRMGLNGEPGKSQEETAQMLGIETDEVSRLLRRAQTRLRKHL